MSFLLTLYILAQTISQGVSVSAGVTAETPAAAGEDFSLRANCYGLFLYNSSDPDSMADGCAGSGTDALTKGGTPTATNTDLPPNVATSSTFYAFDFTGDDYFVHADETDYECTDFTITFWAERDIVTSTDYAIDKATANAGYEVALDSAGVIRFRVDNSSDREDSATAWSIGDWTHAAVRYVDSDAGNDYSVFFDGELDCAGACFQKDAADTTSTAGFEIGAHNAGSAGLDGKMWEVSYFCEKLTDQEICQICRCGLKDDVADRTTECGTCDMGSASCSG